VRIVILLIVSALLSGCAGKYVAPRAGEKVAYLNFVVEADATLGFASALQMLKDPRGGFCRPNPYIAQVSEKHPLLRTNNPPNIPVRAGQEIGVQASIGPIGSHFRNGCTHAFAFVPVADGVYRVKLELGDNFCRARLEALFEGDEWTVPAGVLVTRDSC
jgi:hypothetical protein